MEVMSYIDLKTLLALLVTSLGCYLFLSRRKNLPPGPWSLPLLGHALWLLRRTASPDSTATMFLKASRQYGDLLYLRVARKGLLIVHGYDAIHEVLVTHAEHFNDRPHWLSPSLKKILNEGRGLVWESGEDYKTVRKFALQSLREFGVGKASLEDKVFEEIDAATIVLKESVGDPCDIRSLARLITINVIYSIVFGKRLDYQDKRLHDLLGNIKVIFQRTGNLDFTNQVPNFVLKLFGRDKVKESARRQASANEIKNRINDEIKEHEETFDANKIRDFMDLYIKSKQAGEDKHLFTAGNMIRIIMDLFLAGSDTTSNTIIWCILYMIEYPDVQARCQAELHKVCSKQDIRWSHRNKLPYVEATLMEIQRLANVGELTMFHTNEEERTVRGYTIPKHTLIMANLMSSNIDPKHWDEPEQFRPERFLEDGKIKKNAAFMPFSTGPRTCVGESLAKIEMFLVFTNFLQKFTFKRENDDVPTSFEIDKSHIASTPVAFKTRIVQRF